MSYLVEFKAPQELCNPPSKAVSGKFHTSGRQSKRNCLQNRANFQRSRALQIALIFNTAMSFYKVFNKVSMVY